MDVKKIGLIAGNGKFPIIFAKEAKAQGYKIIAVGIKGDTSFFLKFIVDRLVMISAGELSILFEFFKKNSITKVIMAGQVNPGNLFKKSIKFDDEFKAIFNALNNRKADTIFSAIADKLQNNGIDLLDSTILIKKYLSTKGTLTSRGPTKSELNDIEFGIDIAKRMGAVDVGQTVVVINKAVVAIEAMEGTDKAICRGGKIAKQGAVVVKMSKPNQDFRFDVPVVGPKTIKSMIRCKAKCLAIEAGKTIIIDQKNCLKLANKSGICIVAA